MGVGRPLYFTGFARLTLESRLAVSAWDRNAMAWVSRCFEILSCRLVSTYQSSECASISSRKGRTSIPLVTRFKYFTFCVGQIEID